MMLKTLNNHTNKTIKTYNKKAMSVQTHNIYYISSNMRRIKNCVNFDFIYEKAAPYYSDTGRKSIDPVVLIKNAADRLSL